MFTAEEVLAVVDTNEQEKYDFLKKPLEPWDEVERQWALTFEIRQRTENKIYLYYQEFPCLKQPTGYNLV